MWLASMFPRINEKWLSIKILVDIQVTDAHRKRLSQQILHIRGIFDVELPGEVPSLQRIKKQRYEAKKSQRAD